ncbi:hypothetical protein GQX73_g7583 [Xylaria multiplex]|uniref:Uncharacterized protein n=1 Tax=Xylaria multiplex TaxID=323545 RepID=A0A7C8N3W9_9PEZI|nr:hypothetical protein GQX73_g7583 [Xylaria multiplex]
MSQSQTNHDAFLAAVYGGNVEEVRAFVKDGAVDNPYPRNKQALCLAARKTKDNRTSILRVLLEAKMDVNATFNELDNNTPLMFAIMEFPGDLESIRLLLEKGASSAISNKEHKTAIDLARERHETAILEILQPKTTRPIFQVIIGMIVALILYILAKVNELQNGIINRLFNFGRPVDGTTALAVHRSESIASVEDLKASMNQTVQELQLDRFFKNGNLLERVADNAVKLRENPTTDLGKPENVRKLITLSMYKPVLFCDDSRSMNTGDRLKKQANIVTRITRITTYLVPDDMGVALFFINAPVEGSNNLREDEVAKIMPNLEAIGATELGHNLKEKILKPMLYDKVKRNEELERPILISIITDGHPIGKNEPEGQFIKVLKECSTFLFEHGYPQEGLSKIIRFGSTYCLLIPASLKAVIFQISQIGNDKKAADFLDGLRSEAQIKDMIYCTTDQLDAKYQEFEDNEKGLEEWLLTTLVGPINRRAEGQSLGH